LDFFGAYVRSRGIILVYAILMALLVIFACIAGVFVIYYTIDSAGCISKTTCADSKLKITFFFTSIAELVIGFIGILLQVFSVVLSYKFLKLLKAYETMDVVYSPAQQPANTKHHRTPSSNVIYYPPPLVDTKPDQYQQPPVYSYQPTPYMPAPYSPTTTPQTTPPTSPRASPPSSPRNTRNRSDRPQSPNLERVKTDSPPVLTRSMGEAVELISTEEKAPLLSSS